MGTTGIANHRERSNLADLINDSRLEVERRWLEKVRQKDLARTLTEPELRDSIPDYLVALAKSLREENLRTMQERGGGEWAQVAREHAVTRIRLGFDVGAVIEEFNILRQVLLEVLRERGELAFDQVERVVGLLSGAVSTAVEQYVDSRNYQSRREQAEHIGFITHELRNPLTTAVLTAGRIRKLAGSGQDLARPLDVLDKSLKRLQDLIDQTLLAQRLEANEVESKPVNIRLGDVMEQALKAAEESAARKSVDFHASYDPDVLLCVDPQLALSAIQNVVDNAAKFTDRGRVDVKVEDAPTEVVVHVRDECGGLSPEELRTIFEPFKRGHQGKTGTGLGLSIARRAVEAHGKNIFAASGGESGDRGCHFWFALPKASH